jgi:hypothetical protein
MKRKKTRKSPQDLIRETVAADIQAGTSRSDKMAEDDEAAYVARVKEDIVDWILSPRFRVADEALSVIRLSEIKEQFPVISLKWIEIACEALVKDNILTVPDERSRVKIYELAIERPVYEEEEEEEEEENTEVYISGACIVN